jgi:hypothetical protein
MNQKAVPKVVKAQAKVEKTCMESAEEGNVTDITACATLDAKGILSKTFNKNATDAERYCAQAPDFGFTSANEINTAGVASQYRLSESMFGDLMREWDSIGTGKCRTNVHKQLSKILKRAPAAFTKCKKRGLKDSIRSSDQLAECMRAVANDECQLQIPVSTLFPGVCGQDPTTSVMEQCISENTLCQVCGLLNAADELDQDCDLFDDALANGSCPQ